VRGAAVWALSRLVDRKELDALAANHEVDEADPSVRDEWSAARRPEMAIA
jgi:epoxyqueuosine reductase